MSVSCPVCKSASDLEHWAKVQDVEYYTSDQWYNYDYCRNCDVLFLENPPVNELSVIYPPNYYSFKPNEESILEKVKSRLDQSFFKKQLKKVASPGITVLDIGGGTGWLIDTIKKAEPRFREGYVVDIDANAKKLAESKGYHYFCGRIEEFKTDKKFEVILMLNLIEHVESPDHVLAACFDLLTDDGIIIIKTPNFDSWDARLFRQKNWTGLHAPRHWVVFSAKSFAKALNRNHLKADFISYTQGAPFWATSVVARLQGKLELQQKNGYRPLIFRPLTKLFLAVFAVVDLIRGIFFKTSQMFVVAKKQ